MFACFTVFLRTSAVASLVYCIMKMSYQCLKVNVDGMFVQVIFIAVLKAVFCE